MAHFERIRYKLPPQKLRPRLKACAIWAVCSLYYDRETLSSTSRSPCRLYVNCSTGIHTRINRYLFLPAPKVCRKYRCLPGSIHVDPEFSIYHRSVMSLGALRLTFARPKPRDSTESSCIPLLRLDDHRGYCRDSTTILCPHIGASCCPPHTCKMRCFLQLSFQPNGNMTHLP